MATIKEITQKNILKETTRRLKCHSRKYLCNTISMSLIEKKRDKKDISHTENK